MKMASITTGAAVISLVLTLGLANAADYRGEIMKNVVDPCVKYTVQIGGEVEGLTLEQRVEYVKIIMHEQYERSVGQINDAVQGLSASERYGLYRIAFDSCIEGASQ